MSEHYIKNLQFQSAKSPSIKQKTSIIIWYIFCVIAAIYLTFTANGSKQVDISERQVILLAFIIIYIIRAAITLIYFVKRRIPWWEALWGGSLIGLILFFFLRYGLTATLSFRALDIFGVIIYLFGSYIGTASEYSRHQWKILFEHKGHLYTQGLFKKCRHINYFGDILLFSGLAILTGQPWTVFVPLGMSLNFIFIIIPAHDNYLAARYGAEYTDYSKHSKKLIPFIY